MLFELIRKEILRHLISMRFAIACVLCLLVMLTSLTVRGTEYAQVLDDYHKDSTADRQRVEQWRKVRDLIRLPFPVHRQPNPMKVFVRGVESANGGVVRLVSSGPAAFALPDVQNTSVPLFPSMDMVAFVGLILSLMAVVFGFDAVCGEKQQGTLRMMLSCPVPRDSILLSKWIGGYVTLIMPFLMAVIGTAGIVLVSEWVTLSIDQWLRFAAIVVLSLLFLAAVFSLALWVSCLTARAETSIMVLSALWVVLFLGVPNISPYGARLISPTRSVQQLADHRTEVSERFRNRGGRDAHLGRLEGFRKIDEQFRAEMDAQVRLCRWVSRVSPYACFAMAAAELADEGTVEKQRFLEQLGDFHVELVNYAFDEASYRSEYSDEHDGEHQRTWSSTRQNPIPKFAYVPAAGLDYFRVVAADIAILAALVVLFFMLSYMQFLRYDVR